MCAHPPRVIPVKLRRLFEQQNSLLCFSDDTATVSRWTHSSCSVEEALRNLRRYSSIQRRTVWAPRSFASEEEIAKGKSSVPPPLPHVYSSPTPVCQALDDFPVAMLQPILNAAFLHETSLFSLLLCCPLPSSALAPLARASERMHDFMYVNPALAAECVTPSPLAGHYVMLNGAWSACAPDSDGASWLSAVTPALNVQLSQPLRSTKSHRETSKQHLGVQLGGSDNSECSFCEAEGLASGDYLESLIWPTQNSSDCRPDLQADTVWVDAATVRKYALTYYKDVIWTPLHMRCRFSVWQRARLQQHFQRCRGKDAAACAGNGMVSKEVFSFHAENAARSTNDPEWLGDLYVYGGRAKFP